MILFQREQFIPWKGPARGVQIRLVVGGAVKSAPLAHREFRSPETRNPWKSNLFGLINAI